jgi:hypothetical protein
MGSNLVTPNLAINVIKKICLNGPLRLQRATPRDPLLDADFSATPGEPDFVDIYPPATSSPTDTVKIRILSHEMLSGMV